MLGNKVTQPNLPNQMQYRRAKTLGETYFFTVVTYQRCKILCEPDNVALLREIFCSVMTNHPFTIDAIVILPEHFHAHVDTTRK